MTATSPHAALSIRQFELVAKALADPTRMGLLESISSRREYSCQQLCHEFPVSKGTISHHMKELIRSGLVHARREGQYLFYEVRRDVLAAYTAELLRRTSHLPAG